MNNLGLDIKDFYLPKLNKKLIRTQMNIVDFPPVRCNNLVAGISAVIGIIGGVYLITKTTNDIIW